MPALERPCGWVTALACSARRRRRSRCAGQNLVEFALLAPLFFFVVFAAVNGGLLLYSKNAVDHAADVGMVTLAAEGNCSNGPNCPTSDADKSPWPQSRMRGRGRPALGAS